MASRPTLSEIERLQVLAHLAHASAVDLDLALAEASAADPTWAGPSLRDAAEQSTTMVSSSITIQQALTSLRRRRGHQMLFGAKAKFVRDDEFIGTVQDAKRMLRFAEAAGNEAEMNLASTWLRTAQWDEDEEIEWALWDGSLDSDDAE